MNLIKRTHYLISGNNNLEPFYYFPKFPVFIGYLDQPESDDLKQDTRWWISRASDLIQLNPYLPLDALYPQSHGAVERRNMVFVESSNPSGNTLTTLPGSFHGYSTVNSVEHIENAQLGIEASINRTSP